MPFHKVARYLISEYKLSIEQIGNLTDEQIELLYLPDTEQKKEQKPGISSYQLYRNIWLKRGRSIQEINTAWTEKQKAKRAIRRKPTPRSKQPKQKKPHLKPAQPIRRR